MVHPVVFGQLLGPAVVPFYLFFGEGSPTKIDYRRRGTLILTSLLEPRLGRTDV